MNADYEERQRIEAQEIRRQAEHLKALCHEIALNLPGDWVTVDPDEEEEVRAGGPGLARAEWPGRNIRQQDGHGLINISMGGYQHRGRIVASAEWNGLYDHAPYGSKCPEITLTDTATGQRVAKAITSRLLPKYLPILTQAVERKAKHNDRAVRVAQVARDLAEAMGGKVERYRKSAYPGDMVYLNGLGWLIVHLGYPGTQVSFERAFSTTIEKAIRIVRVYQE